MQRSPTHWTLASDRRPATVAEVLGILLANRGWSPEQLPARLEDLQADAEQIPNLDEGAALLARCLAEDGLIVLIGDYDCDGLTSIAQLALFLRRLGSRRVATATPENRQAGYGMPLSAVREHPEARLFVALDCGSFDHEPIAAARAQGADVLVIDHHAIQDPSALAQPTVLVNPRHPEHPAAFQEYATAGLTLLFLARLRHHLDASGAGRPALNGDFLALAAVGTVADMVPLVGGNRILVRHGLKHLNEGRPASLQALREVAGLTGRRLTAGHIGFQIAPRLNAAARVATARQALDLLLAEDPVRIAPLAKRLDELNRQRQQQVEALDGALREVVARLPKRRTAVLADPAYPVGVNGILAQHVVREVHRPAIVMQIDAAAGTASGSGRSIPGFDLHAALARCEPLLERWGGHAMAAGVTLSLAQLDAFRERLEAVAAEAPAEVFQPRSRADLELDPALAGRELLDALGQLEPYGVGNRAPRFLLRRQRITGMRAFGRAGRADHLELALASGLTAVHWRGAAGCRQDVGDTIDLVCGLDWNEYRGGVQAVVDDLGSNLLERGGDLAAQGLEPRTRGL